MESLSNCYHFKLVDSHWICVDSPFKNQIGEILSDFFFHLGVEIPSYIKYAIIETNKFKIKFREFGGDITLYIHPIN